MIRSTSYGSTIRGCSAYDIGPLSDNHAGMAHEHVQIRSIPLRIADLTALALHCFAANSVLGCMALGPGAIDPASYASIGLASGALMLWLIVTFIPGPLMLAKGKAPVDTEPSISESLID